MADGESTGDGGSAPTGEEYILNELDDDGEYKQVARMVDGEVVEGRERFAAIFPIEEWRRRDTAELQASLNGPEVVLGVRTPGGDAGGGADPADH